MSKTFCPLLFQHLATHPHGGVTHCCISDHRNALSSAKTDNKFFNLNKDKILDIYNSKSFRLARTQVLSNQKPKACLRCYQEEDLGITSKRLAEIKNYPNFTFEKAKKITNEKGEIYDLNFDFVELRLGNVCNLTCVTCNPASSSKWKDDYEILQKKLNFPITNYNNLNDFTWHENPLFWDDLMQYCKYIKVFYINGGEPTLSKQHFKFLSKLVEHKLTNIKLWYNLNLTNLNNDIINLWKNFKEVQISCSIDDLGKRNEYIRYPSKWENIMSNFKRLQKESFSLDITQTVSILNYANLDNFFHFFSDENIWIHHNFVYDPIFLSPKCIPVEFKEIVHQKFQKTLPKNIYQLIFNMFDNTSDNDNWKKAIQYIKNLDNIKNVDISNYIPEFNNYTYEIF